MSTTTTTPQQRIYDRIAKDITQPELYNITIEDIAHAYSQCRSHGLTDKQSEDMIIKMWKTSNPFSK